MQVDAGLTTVPGLLESERYCIAGLMFALLSATASGCLLVFVGADMLDEDWLRSLVISIVKVGGRRASRDASR
jgi:hypothetical protein